MVAGTNLTLGRHLVPGCAQNGILTFGSTHVAMEAATAMEELRSVSSTKMDAARFPLLSPQWQALTTNMFKKSARKRTLCDTQLSNDSLRHFLVRGR